MVSKITIQLIWPGDYVNVRAPPPIHPEWVHPNPNHTKTSTTTPINYISIFMTLPSWVGPDHKPCSGTPLPPQAEAYRWLSSETKLLPLSVSLSHWGIVSSWLLACGIGFYYTLPPIFPLSLSSLRGLGGRVACTTLEKVSLRLSHFTLLPYRSFSLISLSHSESQVGAKPRQS